MTSVRKILVIGSLFALVLLSRAGLAGGVATPQIDQRQANQQRRIDQGIASGELTNREAAHLQNQQMRIERQEAAAKVDGVVTKAERARLMHRQNEASQAIVRKKHNQRRR